jgi:hypothetical protein
LEAIRAVFDCLLDFRNSPNGIIDGLNKRDSIENRGLNATMMKEVSDLWVIASV